MKKDDHEDDVSMVIGELSLANIIAFRTNHRSSFIPRGPYRPTSLGRFLLVPDILMMSFITTVSFTANLTVAHLLSFWQINLLTVRLTSTHI
jgi:hypothetical protein